MLVHSVYASWSSSVEDGKKKKCWINPSSLKFPNKIVQLIFVFPIIEKYFTLYGISFLCKWFRLKSFKCTYIQHSTTAIFRAIKMNEEMWVEPWACVFDLLFSMHFFCVYGCALHSVQLCTQLACHIFN